MVSFLSSLTPSNFPWISRTRIWTAPGTVILIETHSPLPDSQLSVFRHLPISSSDLSHHLPSVLFSFIPWLEWCRREDRRCSRGNHSIHHHIPHLSNFILMCPQQPTMFYRLSPSNLSSLIAVASIYWHLSTSNQLWVSLWPWVQSATEPAAQIQHLVCPYNSNGI